MCSATKASKLAPAGYNFHSGILKARPDLNCVIHVHATPGVVIAATKGGLEIVDQSGCHLYGEIAGHDFEGFAQEEDEVPRILRDLGDKHCLMMWNHGLLTVGRTLGEAFQYMRRLIDACALYERLLATGAEIRPIPQGRARLHAQADRREAQDARLQRERVALSCAPRRTARPDVCGVNATGRDL